MVLSVMSQDAYVICVVCRCQLVCPSVCFGEKERAKCRTPFLLGYKVFQVSLSILMRLRSVPLMGGPRSPSVSRSPEDSSSEEGGAAHGPLHPALLTSKLSGFGVSSGMFRQKGFCLGLLFRGFALRENCMVL